MNASEIITRENNARALTRLEAYMTVAVAKSTPVVRTDTVVDAKREAWLNGSHLPYGM